VVAAGRLLVPAFAVLVVAQVTIGSLFGATQTGATVLATDLGKPGLAGFVHATLGVGSALAGLATAYVPERIGHERRALVAAWALLAFSVPLLLVDTLLATTATVLVLGLAVAPYMIAVFSLAERVVPPSRVGAAMTMLASATGLGYALGSSLAGRLADTSGATAAFSVTVGATGVAVLLMSSQQQRLRSATAATPADVAEESVSGDPVPCGSSSSAS
jgi:MFS family permease